MKMLTKNLIGGAVFGALALTGALTASATADDETEIHHKVIEIKAFKDKEATISVLNGDDKQALFFTQEELEDENLIYDKLSHLDDETRETVLGVLENIKMGGNGKVEVFSDEAIFMNKGKGQSFIFLGKDDSLHELDLDVVHDGDHKRIKKQFVFGSGKDGVLRGHTDAIVTMIERGEFDQEQLDKIQAAVDAKR